MLHFCSWFHFQATNENQKRGERIDVIKWEAVSFMNEKGVGECLSGERSSARKANGIERTDKERVRRTKKWKRKWRSSGRISEEERKNSVKD